MHSLLVNDKPDIVCITETWLDKHVTDAMIIYPFPYTAIRVDRNSNGGGVLILLRDNLIFRSFNLNFSRRASIVHVDVFIDDKCVRLITLYRPPNVKVAECDDILDHLDNIISSCSHNVICVGDFNLSPTIQSRYDAYNTLFDDHSLHQHVSQPTCGNNMLDLVLTDDKDLIGPITYNPPLSSSDHICILFQIRLVNLNMIPTIPRPNWGRTDFQSMKTTLATIDWENALSGFSDMDELYSTFCGIIIELFGCYVPISYDRKAVKWPGYIQKLIQHRIYLFQRLTANNMCEYNNVSRRLSKLIHKYESRLEKNVLTSLSSAKLFSFIKSKLNSNSSIPVMYNSNGNPLVKEIEKAEFIADYFQSVYTNLNLSPPTFHSKPITVLSSFLIEPDCVRRACKSLKKSCSITADGIPQVIFRECYSELALPLAHVFNFSLRLGTIPTIWKYSFVTPIQKVSHPSSPSDYRPVSITSTACKVMERCIKLKLDQHLKRNSIIPIEQFGFRRNISITDQMLICSHDWVKACDKNNFVDVIYFDVSKAFDSLCHKLLLQKLRSIGVSGNLFCWIRSFLTDRFFSVRIQNTTSTWKPISSGVPQGSVLGPILFNIFMADLPNALRLPSTISLLQFADDLKLYGNSHSSAHSLHTDLQQSISKLKRYLDSVGLSLSVSKCGVLHSGPKNPRYNYCIDHGVPLKKFDTVRDLGIMVNSTGDHRAHIKKITANARLQMFKILKVFKTTDSALLSRMFNVYVRPILESGSQVWSPFLKKDVESLEKVQKTFSRILYYKSFPNHGYPQQLPDYEKRIQKLRLSNLELRRKILDLVYVYKMFNHHSRNRFSSFFTLSPSDGRKTSFKVVVPFAKKNAFLNSFFVRSARWIQVIPVEFWQLKSVIAFKKAMIQRKDILKKLS